MPGLDGFELLAAGPAAEPGPGDHADGPHDPGRPRGRPRRRGRRLPAQAVRHRGADGPDPGRAPPGRPVPRRRPRSWKPGRSGSSRRHARSWPTGPRSRVTTVEYDILEFLVHSAGRIVSRDELTAALYRRRATKFDRTLDMHICNLRKKLGRHGDLIRTVRGVGYLCRVEPERPGGRMTCGRSSPRSCSGRSGRSPSRWSHSGPSRATLERRGPPKGDPFPALPRDGRGRPLPRLRRGRARAARRPAAHGSTAICPANIS